MLFGGGVNASYGSREDYNWEGEWGLQTVVVLRGGTINNSWDFPWHLDGSSWAVIFEGDVNVAPGVSLSGLFAFLDTPGGPHSIDVIDLPRLDTTGVTDMSHMFETHRFRADVSQLNTSSVTTMEGMFAGGLFSRIIDISSWDTSQVTNMRQMFVGFRQFHPGTFTIPSTFDTSSVTNMSQMFAQSDIEHLDLSMFDTSNVTDMSEMFRSARVGSLDLTSFETHNVTDMNNIGLMSNI